MPTRFMVRILMWLMIVSLTCGAIAATFPPSTLTEEELSNHPSFEVFMNPHLNTAAYYPSLPEEDLVVNGSAYLAPLIIFENETPVLLLNAIVANQSFRFGLKRIEFDFAEELLAWDVQAYDASDDGFYADEVYLPVDEKLMQTLMFIADHPYDEMHISLWGDGGNPLHFALTKNQILVIQEYLKVYLGMDSIEAISI